MASLHISIILLFMTIILSLSGCGKKQEAEHKGSSQIPAVRGVTTEIVKSVQITETLDVVGTVRARTSAVVSARISGTVSVLSVREGDRVRKGQVLARLEAQENQAAAAVATAGIEEAQRALEEARSSKRLADSTFERYQKLLGDQVVSRQDFDIKQTERDLAAQAVARAEAKVQQAREGSKAASTVADYTKIIAPITGIITSKQADLGATVFPAQPLMTIEDEGSYQLQLAIPESMLLKIKPGAAAVVTLDSGGASFRTKIAEIVPTTDPASRTFIAKINLSQKGMKSGMFGRASLELGTSVNAMTVPQKAIVERGALISIWVLDKENIARIRLVKVGRTNGNRAEIVSGLTDGERIVVDGAEKLNEGAKVE